MSLLRVLVMFFLSGFVASAMARENDPAIARFEGFLAALGQGAKARADFVEKNFTERVIDKRGVAQLAELMGVLHQDFGGARPLRVMTSPAQFEALFKFADRDEQVELVVKFSSTPERQIDGFFTQIPAAATPAAPVTTAQLPEAISALVKAKADAGFSGVVLVAHQDDVLYGQAFGQADRATGRANTLDTPFNLASNNKMFTALLIARLVELGKLDWQGKVGDYLPEWPQKVVREQVSIAMLLSHTAGLGDYWGPAHDAARAELDTVEEYAQLFADQAPAAAPGSAFRYSNNGFVLLGLIAEQVTGRDYYALVDEYIFRPAAMTHSAHYTPDASDSGRAIGYDRSGQPNSGHLELRGSPAGGGYASAQDLLRFARALLGGKLVSPDTLKRMTTRHADMGGPMAGYGYGFGVFADGEPHFGHEGGAPGVQASFEIFPQSGYVVIVMANSEAGGPGLARQIVQLILKRTP